MAKIYTHKSRGYQVRYTVYFPDGSSVVKYRYAKGQSAANLLFARCEYLESGSRAGNLQPREIARAQHDGLLDGDEAAALYGGTRVAIYDLTPVMKNYEASSQVANTAYGHMVNMRRAKWIEQWLVEHPIPGLTAADVKFYVLARRNGSLVYPNAKTGTVKIGCSAKTALNELTVMQHIIDEAVRLGMVKTNVAREVHVPVKTSRMRRSMVLEEIQRLIESAEGNRHLCHGLAYEAAMVALYTGLRRGELRTLEWPDIDLESQTLVVQSKELVDGSYFTPKSGVARRITLPDPVVPILAGMERKGRYVFGGDRLIPANRFYKTIKELLARANLPRELSLHHTRHTFTSWLLRLTGGDLKYVQSEVGHLDISTTKKYSHPVTTDSPAKRLKYD